MVEGADDDDDEEVTMIAAMMTAIDYILILIRVFLRNDSRAGSDW